MTAQLPPNDYATVHQRRWELSRRWLSLELGAKHPARILEVGGASDFTQQMGDMWPDSQIDNTPFDVRLPESWEDIPSGEYDLAINTEVIEHLPDLPTDGPICDVMTSLSGVKVCLIECLNALKPGGIMFLTTPNTSSIACLYHWEYYQPLYTWTPHIREFSYMEVVDLVKAYGFEIIRAGTEDPYVILKTPEERTRRTQLMHAMARAGVDMHNRGETTFILARKPVCRS